MNLPPYPWMAQQQQAGHRLCLVLEGDNDVCQSLLEVRTVSQYCSFYAGTVVAELKTTGPMIVLLQQMSEPGLLDLLQRPETNGGWLGSLPSEDLAGVTRHWRDRLLVGTQDNPALYRFHDNRTLARALNHLAPEHWPAFLGPLISVCYWHEGGWHSRDNPSPGDYPVPDSAPWLNISNPHASVILHANVLRYLLAEHSEDLAALMEFQDPRVWLTQVLVQAHAWQWREPSQLEFLVVRRLEEATRSSVIRWQPMPGEASGDHFERVVKQWRLMREQDE